MAVTFKARSVRKIKGGVTIYDYRGTGLVVPPRLNGKFIRINPLLYVHHIPVIKNVKGVGDLMTLARVLRDQRLSIHHADDAEGNIFLFAPMNVMCYHAKGANQFSIGNEHQHYGLDEKWTDRHMKAAAVTVWNAGKYQNVPALKIAALSEGNGIVGVRRPGQTRHSIVADKAGYDDRRDPGAGFLYKELFEYVRFFDKHRHF